MIVVPHGLLIWFGHIALKGPLSPMNGHINGFLFGFAFLPCGPFALGLAGFDMLAAAVGLHLREIGGIGGMMRAPLGYAGLALQVSPMLGAAFARVALAALRRMSVTYQARHWMGAELWTAGFVVRYAPILASAVAGRKLPY